MRESQGKGSIKVTLRTQAAATRQYCGDSGRARIFIRTRTGAGKTLRLKDGEPHGRIFSHRDLSRMTDHRVPHLRAD
jgi:hypothetical protein